MEASQPPGRTNISVTLKFTEHVSYEDMLISRGHYIVILYDVVSFIGRSTWRILKVNKDRAASEINNCSSSLSQNAQFI